MNPCEFAGDSEVYEQLARIGKAVSTPTRLQLLHLLCHGKRTVQVLADAAGLSVANASNHLQVLREARLVESKKDGLYVTYQIADESVGRFLMALREVAESRSLELERFARLLEEATEGIEAVSADELAGMLAEREVVVVDLRPVEEFEAGHIPGAVSIPARELKRRLGELPRDRPIVAYCRGPYCAMAAEAVRTLRDAGFDVMRLEESVPDWRARGMPVEARINDD
ncbi:MAG: ArsR/SmtB family transcription factor [Armatimonadota bacterium]|jgi:rhodanese-related sulfurtransferase/DNA-binding transcriptional ArsR family regulator